MPALGAPALCPTAEASPNSQQQRRQQLLTRMASRMPALGARTSTVTLSVSICAAACLGGSRECDAPAVRGSRQGARGCMQRHAASHRQPVGRSPPPPPPLPPPHLQDGLVLLHPVPRLLQHRRHGAVRDGLAQGRDLDLQAAQRGARRVEGRQAAARRRRPPGAAGGGRRPGRGRRAAAGQGRGQRALGELPGRLHRCGDRWGSVGQPVPGAVEAEGTQGRLAPVARRWVRDGPANLRGIAGSWRACHGPTAPPPLPPCGLLVRCSPVSSRSPHPAFTTHHSSVWSHPGGAQASRAAPSAPDWSVCDTSGLAAGLSVPRPAINDC